MTHTHPEAMEYEAASAQLLQAAAKCDGQADAGFGFFHRCSLPAGHTGPHQCELCALAWASPVSP